MTARLAASSVRADPRALIALARRLSPRTLSLLFIMPLIYGAIRQVLKAEHWFNDFEAIACGGMTLASGHALYGPAMPCPGAQPADYVYTPHFAMLLARLDQSFGPTLFAALYGALYCALVWRILRDLLAEDAGLRARAPFLICLSVSALTKGNVSIIIHAGVYLLAGLAVRWPWPMLAAIMGAAMLKPTFAVYLALPLFLPRPLPQRLLVAAVGAVGTLGYFLWFRASDPELFVAWMSTARHFGLVVAQGHGFFGLPFIERLTGTAWLLPAYLVFAVLVLGSGLLLAERFRLGGAERMALGVAVCVLLYPRLMAYDVMTLPFGLAVLAGCFRGAGRFRAGDLALVLQLACLIFGLIGGRAGGRLMFDLDCVLLLGLAAWSLTGSARRMV